MTVRELRMILEGLDGDKFVNVRVENGEFQEYEDIDILDAIDDPETDMVIIRAI